MSIMRSLKPRPLEGKQPGSSRALATAEVTKLRGGDKRVRARVVVW